MARIAGATGRTDEAARWRKLADDDPGAPAASRPGTRCAGHLTEHLGQPGTVDASLLALPLRRVIDGRRPADDGHRRRRRANGWAPATTCSTATCPTESPDGCAARRARSCSARSGGWTTSSRAAAVDEAEELFERLCARVNHVGLLPEQIDPTTGEFLGNFPQAFSHIGLISSAVNLARARAGDPRRTSR